MSEFQGKTFNRNLSGLDLPPDVLEVFRQHQDALDKVQEFLRQLKTEPQTGVVVEPDDPADLLRGELFSG